MFPFDWDGDGLENSVDPEPLVAGPDAHGTNAEWYNVVCSNVFSAAEVGGAAHGDMRPPDLILVLLAAVYRHEGRNARRP